ncbi:hypothetical protein SK571_05320 [Lentzea sp. BCCO 10_0798]|uniref:Uncharacterized protein n=1 Tax=Lentzea kristufekii TaxID=3095430 RepID=A0ABU4TKJ4_9PSEU|nr:hypothetical protein [Lentzea sp. BCCO 10_0798]MDX8048790.1 hypothetical protein [Lentzea sp. BCCO 10_0798]
MARSGTAPVTLTKWIREVADEPLLLTGDLLAQAEENTWSLGRAKGETPVAAEVVAAFEETARRLGERVTAMERTATFYVWYDAQAGHLKCSTSSAKKDALPFGAKVDPDATLAAVVGGYLAGASPAADEDVVLPVWTAEVGL